MYVVAVNIEKQEFRSKSSINWHTVVAVSMRWDRLLPLVLFKMTQQE